MTRDAQALFMEALELEGASDEIIGPPVRGIAGNLGQTLILATWICSEEPPNWQGMSRASGMRSEVQQQCKAAIEYCYCAVLLRTQFVPVNQRQEPSAAIGVGGGTADSAELPE